MDKKYFCVVILFIGLCHGVSKAIECTERGRFPNDESADCRGYTMCLLGGLTNFTQYKLMCPMGSVYSHLEKQCTNASNYKCLPNFNCTSVGNFEDPESSDCSSYVACIDGMGSIGTPRVLHNEILTIDHDVTLNCMRSRYFDCRDMLGLTPLQLFYNRIRWRQYVSRYYKKYSTLVCY
ncbi:hypothetical protein PYW07_016109 [Mythimna separata]|uniref:Chitin-binding type-2 domain-containing protein n=1 Tax=Mythimna separata TaxID=271217 RepID=A0AAD7YSI1_MYTSE|nr:hypothetical protein PYW07_016109 [Mythimna separata]